MKRFIIAAALTLVPLASSSAWAIFVDNGVVGDGFWSVDVLAGGESRTGILDPTGSPGGIGGTTEIIFDYFHYIDVGANGGGIRLGDTTITTAPILSGPSEVTSGGLFLGENGTINWAAVSSIDPGSLLYLTALTFTSGAPFGTLRTIQYLDEDVVGSSDDVLVEIGTPGAAGFQLLTIDDNLDIGVSHSAGFLTAANMTYTGFAADEFSDLRGAIQGGGAAYSIPGVVDTFDLPPIVDPRFPGLPAFGPADITSALAFDVDPSATFASVLYSLGGAPSGVPPPAPVPEPSTLLLLSSGLAGLVAWRMKKAKA